MKDKEKAPPEIPPANAAGHPEKKESVDLLSPGENQLKTIVDADGKKWRPWMRGYEFNPGESVTIHPKYGRVITGGKQ